MSADLLLRSGTVVVKLDRDERLLLLTCERHVVEHVVPLHWPNVVPLLHDFLDRHLACQDVALAQPVRQSTSA